MLQIPLYSLGEVGVGWSLQEVRVLIIVSSTTGDGEQPENVVKFWRAVRNRSLPRDHLSHLQFALLGLGDTNYSQFCAAPRALHRRLTELGAKPFQPAAWADDGTGLEETVEPWLEGLWTALEQLRPGMQSEQAGGPGVAPIQVAVAAVLEDEFAGLSLPACPQSHLSVSYSEGEVPSWPGSDAALLPGAAGPLHHCQVEQLELLSSGPEVKEYYEVTVSSQLEYTPGDTVGVVASNLAGEVAWLAARLELQEVWTLPCQVELAEKAGPRARLPAHIPSAASLQQIFTHALDIRAPTRKALLRALVAECSKSQDRAVLARLCSKQGADQYRALLQETKLGLLAVLELAPSCRPPSSLLLQHLPRLLPRPYSLSSSPRHAPGRPSWVFTRVTAPLPGLATSLLAEAGPGTSLTIYPRTPGQFRPPVDASQPTVLVAAGSGIGPFLGFLRDRAAVGPSEAQSRAGCWLLLGCRGPADSLHASLLDSWLADNTLSRLSRAFSRHGGPAQPRYVQDAMREAGSDLVTWLTQHNAVLYVCGDARGMAKGVRETVASVYECIKGVAEGEGEKFVKQLMEEKRYKEDIWS